MVNLSTNSGCLNTPSGRALLIAFSGVVGLICVVIGVILTVNCLLKRQDARKARREVEQARRAKSQTLERHRTARVVNGIIYGGVNPATGRICTVGSLDAIVNDGMDTSKQEVASHEMADKTRSQPERVFRCWRRAQTSSIDCESQIGRAQAIRTERESGLARKMMSEKRENIFIAFWGFLKSWASVERSK